MGNQPECQQDELRAFEEGVNAQLWRPSALMIGNAVLVASMVVVSATGRRYRHSAATRFISLGATTLFLPIVSYVVSSIGNEYCKVAGTMKFECNDFSYVFLLLMWTVLIQTVGINITAIISVSDGDGQKVRPSVELLARTLWTSYLVFYYYNRGCRRPNYPKQSTSHLAVPQIHVGFKPVFLICPWRDLNHLLSLCLIALCVLSFVKITLRFCAFEKAMRSFALGRNARLVSGYMEQLQGQQSRDELMPPLIVMGEEKQQIEERPQGYIINLAMVNNSLVTIDKVWLLASTRDILLSRRPQLKDLCLSFALFKLLRRRFARCQLAESGSTKQFNLVRGVLLSDGGPDRVFGVIADEVSLDDYYYSSLPACNLGKLLPILNIIVSCWE